ncbi:MAG: hypothetical protein AAF514_04480 [Verrucomicrobiota bacterium]
MTRWTLVARAGADANADGPVRDQALEELCAVYYHPIYTYALCSGTRADNAMDLTQGFFEHAIRNDVFARADAEKGRLRSFLLTAFKNFAAAEHRNATAAKRGGGQGVASLDEEDRHGVPAIDRIKHDGLTPEEAYDKAFALVQLDRALAILREEKDEAGKGELFDHLRPYLQGDGESYDTVARVLQMPPETARVQVHRMRKRLGEIFRAVVFDSVGDPGLADDEIRALRQALES